MSGTLRIMVVSYVLSVYVSISDCQRHNDVTLLVGSACQRLGVPGICQKVVNCPSAIERVKTRGNHDLKRCGFQGRDEIVCCHGNERKSERMCEEFYTDYNIKPGLIFHNILAGNNATTGQFPHAAFLGFENSNGEIEYTCGASLISTRFLLTAAHCFICNGCSDPKKARLGTVELTDSKFAQDIDVKDVTPHPDYNPITKSNDIAIVELVKDVLTSELVYPACLYTEVNEPRYLQILGWLHYGNYERSRFLEYARIQPITLKECNEAIPTVPPKVIAATQICAFNGACTGPSGNPVQFHNEKGGYDIVGIISYGWGCSTKIPEVYTRVASYLDWIEPIVWPDLIRN